MSNVVILLLLGLAVSGCGSVRSIQSSDALQTPVTKTAEPGDRVDIHYLCRLKTGEVAAATDVAPETEPKANIFVMRKETIPVAIVAALRDEPLSETFRPAPFDIAIWERIRRGITGMKEGETRQMELTAGMVPGETEQAGFALLSRVRTRPKEKKYLKDEYEFRAGKAPEVGQDFSTDPVFPGKVDAVTDTEVVVRFAAKNGDVIETPFGPGTIREEADKYTVDINAKEGSLVRTGNKIGRISRVDETVITVDYRHAFGYETLICDVKVENIIKDDPIEISTGVK